MSARKWLAAHGYTEALACIEEAERRWKAAGKKTRRDWWETLAGGVGGRPRTVWGVAFPVLEVAQRHQGLPVTQNAVPMPPGEEPPPKQAHGRALTLQQQREQ